MATMTHTDVAPTSEADDIRDPDVPFDVSDPPAPAGPASATWREHEALLHGFTAQLQRWMLQYHKEMMVLVEATLQPVKQCLMQAACCNEHAQYQLADALLKLQEGGIKVQTSPYIVTVHATTPQGYSTMLTIQKSSAPELVEGVTALTTWLQQAGYTGVQIQSPA